MQLLFLNQISFCSNYSWVPSQIPEDSRQFCFLGVKQIFLLFSASILNISLFFKKTNGLFPLAKKESWKEYNFLT